MRFNLVDRIVEVKAGESIRVVKHLTLGEEYLADHFPTFPVMPGVLMLQLLIEAGAWLLRISDDFRHSVIVVREASHVKYGTFMEPGKRLEARVDLVERKGGNLALFKGKGEVEGATSVTAKLTLEHYNLADRNSALRSVDQRLVEHLRNLYTVIRGDLSFAPQAGNLRETTNA